MADIGAALRAGLADRYTIERELGAGGMATVYLARDLRHDRRVALKVLRPELAAVIGAARFLIEIKTTANLQHPHILPLHDSGEVDGTVFYVMPYVEGETLRDRLDRDRQLPIEMAIRIATEVAGALEHAHQHGVIHRDIKPENILLQEGHALVADFGIALAAVRSDGGSRMTETGMSLGTPHYMSPEQAMGEREITARSDVYALGCVLYEMLAGEPPFTGPSAQAIIARVITEEPRSLTVQRRTVPRNVEAVVRTALAKLPADRFGSAKEFSAALADARYGPVVTGSNAVGTGVPSRQLSAKARWVAIGTGAAVLIGAFVAGRVSTPEPERVPVQFTLEVPDSVTQVNRCCGRAHVLSPDGSTLVFVGMKGTTGALYRRSVGQLDAELIPGTEEASIPFFSPDGRWLAFYADGRLRKVAMAGGPSTPIASAAQTWGASWGDNDIIVFGGDGRLHTVPAAGGTPTQVPLADSSEMFPTLRYPFMLPGSEWALVAIRGTGPLSEARIGVIELATGRIDTLGYGVRAEYASGYLLFAGADQTLLAQPFDPVRRRTTGAATVLLSNVAFHGATTPQFTASTNGWLEYQEGTSTSQERLTISTAASGTRITLPGRVGIDLEDPAISPDGRRIAIRLPDATSGAPSLGGTGVGDLWIFDRQQGTLNRFTVGGGRAPVWSRDGRRIAYSAPDAPPNPAGIYVRAVDQSGSPELLLASGNTYAGSWLPSDRGLIISALNRGRTRDDIGLLTFGDSTPRWLVNSEFSERLPALSFDGRRLAFTSDRTGRYEVYVQPITGDAAPVQISTDGGGSPRWGREGTLFYVGASAELIAATLSTGTGIEVTGRRVVLASGLVDLNATNVNWDILPDGKQFLHIDREGATYLRMVMIQNWVELARSLGAAP